MKNDIKKTDEITRENIDEKYKWKLSDLYESQDAWKEQKISLEKAIEKFDSAIIYYKNAIDYNQKINSKYQLEINYQSLACD